MKTIYAYCDESGKHQEHKVVVFSALVADSQTWQSFGSHWMQLLSRYELNHFSMKEAVRYSQKYGSMKKGTAKERAADILPLIQAIANGLELGVTWGVEVSAYKAPSRFSLRINFGDDPHFFVFHNAVMSIIRHYKRLSIPWKVGLILDDDEAKAIPCYQFLRRMKRASEEVRNHVDSICFSNDKASPYVQAADAFSYLYRISIEEAMLGKPHEYQALTDIFKNPNPFQCRIRVEDGTYRGEQLDSFLANALSEAWEKRKPKT
ncbi:MAG: DUF3800 domain-containing protein [Acidobacteriia bacterium]|nr:DUF3800 domain-containing protein [Terriglobia bacterium]